MTEPPHEHQDIVFLTVKSFDTARAATEAVHMVGPGTVVVSIQNGLGNIETLVKTFGKEKIIGVNLTARLTSRVKDIADMLDSAGIPAKASDNIMRDIWHKALYITASDSQPLSRGFFQNL